MKLVSKEHVENFMVFLDNFGFQFPFKKIYRNSHPPLVQNFTFE